ncbi:MAG TPA: hypothetical protein PKW80_11330 [Bacteroidales bacterium]|nr:hypothetical protein [Bacteroidales bacterium]
MIDFVHLHSKIDDYRKYLNDDKFQFVEGIVHKSKKRLPYFWFNDIHSHLIYKVGYSNWLDITGSITKHWYHENYTNLPYSDLCCAIHSLADTLNKRPNELFLRSFEFGLNIHMFKNKSALELTELALNYKNNFFENISNNNKYPSIGIKCKLQEYEIKIYSKSIEYNLPFELLRCEIKVKKMRWVRKHQIETLEDLTNKDKLNALKHNLIDSINDITFYDDTIKTGLLIPREHKLCLNWQSEIYRKNLLKYCPKKFEYQKTKINSILEKNGKMHLKRNIKEQITKSWENLLNL